MGLGMPEVILILVVALIVFGPRKLPDLGKSLGQAMSQFRRASDDFKRTWEQEVETEKYRKGESTNSSASYDYSASNSYSDPYNPDSGNTDSPETSSSASEKQEQSSSVDSPAKPEAAKTEVAAAGAGVGQNTTAESKQQHWI